MSSILIKGADMPENCGICNALYHGALCHVVFKSPDERPKNCPLIEVPEPHGRLIDADKYLNKVKYEAEGMSDDYGNVFIGYTEWVLGKEPAVIEAEEQEYDD